MKIWVGNKTQPIGAPHNTAIMISGKTSKDTEVTECNHFSGGYGYTS